MGNSIKEIAFSKNVVEFVTVANEYCSFVENITELEKDNMIDKSVKLLSLLYLKANLLPESEQISDEPNEKFVTEFDWQFVRNGIEVLLTDDDKYLDFYDSEMNETAEPVSSSISENMADIYQDIKDFLNIYKLGNEELSNDAIHECYVNFRDYWGFRLVNSLRIFHYLIYKKNKEDQPAEGKVKVVRDINNWFISKAQQNFKENE
jgi:hypothetical protein